MGKTIYVVTSGEYSSYGIDEVFTDSNQAELYCAVHTDCEIEEYEADRVHLEGQIYYGIKFNIDALGSVTACYGFKGTEKVEEKIEEKVIAKTLDGVLISRTITIPTNKYYQNDEAYKIVNDWYNKKMEEKYLNYDYNRGIFRENE